MFQYQRKLLHNKISAVLLKPCKEDLSLLGLMMLLKDQVCQFNFPHHEVWWSFYERGQLIVLLDMGQQYFYLLLRNRWQHKGLCLSFKADQKRQHCFHLALTGNIATMRVLALQNQVTILWGRHMKKWHVFVHVDHDPSWRASCQSISTARCG